LSRLQRFRELFWALLLPVSLLWAAVTWARRRWYPKKLRYRSQLPVLCVGNLHTGGSGKTPLVAEIADHFRARNPVILSRGYRSASSDAGAWLDASEARGPERYGDEPWMLAKRLSLPVYVGCNRTKALEAIEALSGNGLVVMDDGFQHLKVERDIDLVAIQAARHPLDSFCLPLGDLREPYSSLRAASAIVLVGRESDMEPWKALIGQVAPELPVFSAIRRVEGLWNGAAFHAPSEGRLAGFCGIAYPKAFEQELLAFPESRLVRAFSDHHAFTSSDVDGLLEHKREMGAGALVTTEKDWYKAAPLFEARGEKLLALRIRYELSSEFWRFLEQRLEA
jgi:tetraacyldisaccharide 4'-kinase